jgi:uncharacterized repeat protein (TIGR03803 family)
MRIQPIQSGGLARFFIIAVGLACSMAGSVPAHAQTYKDIYNFDNSAHGCCPGYPSIFAQGRDGNLYDTALGGNGIVFKIAPGGNTPVVIYNFDGTHGTSPRSGLTLGTDGNFYGTTKFGGGVHNAGTIFKITPSGVITTLYSFTGGSDGGRPVAPPVQGMDGNFYGTTTDELFPSPPTAYKITSAGGKVRGNTPAITSTTTRTAKPDLNEWVRAA